MRHRLDRVVVGVERTRKELLTVAGGAHGIDDERDARLVPAALEVHESRTGHVERLALVGGIEGVEKLARGVDEGELGGGRPGVDAQDRVDGVAALEGGRPRRGHLGGMATHEIGSLLLRGKEGLHGGRAVVYGMLGQVAQDRDARREVDGVSVSRGLLGRAAGRSGGCYRCGLRALRTVAGAVGPRAVGAVSRTAGTVGTLPRVLGKEPVERERGAAGDDHLRIGGHHGLAGRELQLLGEHAHERGVVGKRAALEDDGRLDVYALRQAANGLARHGMQGREREVGARDPLVEQGLDVGLGIHAAPTRDLVHARARGGELLEPLGRDAEELGHLVDERTGAARAAAVHAHVRDLRLGVRPLGMEEEHLGILAAELDGAADLRVELADGDGVGHDLLNVVGAEGAGDVARARAGHRHARRHAGEAPPDLFERLGRACRLPRPVALVAPVEDVVRDGIEHHDLGGGRADVESYADRTGHPPPHRSRSRIARPRIRPLVRAYRIYRRPSARRGIPLRARGLLDACIHICTCISS